MKIINEYCKGCCVYMPDGDPHDIGCTLFDSNNKGQCPCSKCIVKVMCEEPCEDYEQFRKSFIGKEDTYDVGL